MFKLFFEKKNPFTADEEYCGWNSYYGNHRSVRIPCVMRDVTIHILLLPDFTMSQNSHPSEPLTGYHCPSDHPFSPLHWPIHCSGKTVTIPRCNRKLHCNISYGTLFPRGHFKSQELFASMSILIRLFPLLIIINVRDSDLIKWIAKA